MYQKEAIEKAMIAGCGKAERASQKLLYEKYNGQMMLLCCRYLTNQEEAKEALMDGFLNCFKNINNFEYRGEGSLFGWLQRIMINQCLMRLRASNRHQMLSVENENFEELTTGELQIQNLSTKEILKLIGQLPDGYRTVFNLYHVEGLGHKVIGKLLAISENTSKSQLAKAKQKLRQWIIENDKVKLN